MYTFLYTTYGCVMILHALNLVQNLKQQIYEKDFFYDSCCSFWTYGDGGQQHPFSKGYKKIWILKKAV